MPDGANWRAAKPSTTHPILHKSQHSPIIRNSALLESFSLEHLSQGFEMSAQKLVQETRDFAQLHDNICAYRKYIQGGYKGGEKTRSKNRSTYGCLSKDWNLENLEGRSILVNSENGIGDVVLTASCLNDLIRKENCGPVSWACERKLHTLFTRSFPEVTFVEQPTTLTSDGQIYSFELIGKFRECLKQFPWQDENGGTASYLKALPELSRMLKDRYKTEGRRTVGLAWRSERSGEVLTDKTCSIYDNECWEVFFKSLKDRIQFVSLQYGDTSSEIDYARWKYDVEIFQDQTIDIYEDVDAAAAQIAAMDCVVSISTTTAHLAGALGVPGIVLLKMDPFAHWRAGETICPWYPTLRPIRQTNAGDWKSVLAEASAKLNEFLLAL